MNALRAASSTNTGNTGGDDGMTTLIKRAQKRNNIREEEGIVDYS
jgi:hypothetical protein